MKKKIYTMVLATLGLFASVDVGAQTWSWTPLSLPEKTNGNSITVCIRNNETGSYIVSASETMTSDPAKAGKMTVKYVYEKQSITNWTGFDGYVVLNEGNKYLTAGGLGLFNVNNGTRAKLAFNGNESGYKMYYDGLGDYYLRDNDGTLAQGAANDSNNTWMFVTKEAATLFPAFEPFKTTLNDEKAEALWPILKYNEDGVTEKVYNKDNFAAVKDIPAAYLAAIEAIDIEMPTVPEDLAESSAYTGLVSAIEKAKGDLATAIAGDLSAMNAAIVAAKENAANAKAILDAVVDAYNTINASVSGNGEAAMAALTTLVSEANQTLKGTTDVEKIAKIVADFNDALTLVGDVDILFDNITMLKKQAEVAIPAVTPAANAFAGKIAALNAKANDVADEAALQALTADIQAANTYIDHFTTVKNAVENAKNTKYVESKAKAYETLQASLKEAYNDLLKATKDADLTAVNDAVIAAEAAYNLKAGNVDAVETIKTESFEGNEQLAAFAAEAAEAIQSASTQEQMDAIIANLNNRVMTDVVRGNIDDSKAAEGSDVDINDYAELASIILKATYTRQQKPELSETPDMAERLAVRKYNLCDANEDNKVNVADLTKIVIIIKGQTQSFAKGMNAISGTISTVAAGNDLIFNLANTGMMTGMQLDVTLPAGISVMNQTLSARAANHSIEVSNIGGNTYRVLINGFDNAAFADNSGEMFRLSLTGNATEVAVSEAYASDAHANSCDLLVAGNSVTGINTVNAQQADAVAIYSIGGKQQSSMNKGVNILVGADGKANKVLK